VSLSYHELSHYHRTHPVIRLLRADNAPLILAFVDYAFVRNNDRTVRETDLISKLDDLLYGLRESGGGDIYPRASGDYLDEWARNENGWLRKFYPPGSDEPHFDLTPATEKALTWIDSLSNRSFIGTESRLLTIFDLLRQMVSGAQSDPEIRIAELERKKEAIDREISGIRNGSLNVMDDTALRERFMQFATMARELLSDFRAVEQNFRELDSRVREQIATWEGSKGSLLDRIFGDRDLITDSDQGRSFRAFWDFLMSVESQNEFTQLLDQIFAMDAVAGMSYESRLRRVHFDWLEAGESTQRTVASLSQQLRRYLDNQVYLENKRIMRIMESILQGALAVRDAPPRGTFMEIDNSSPDIALPMERLLYSPPPQVSVDSLITLSSVEAIDTSALFSQLYVDLPRLRANIVHELRKKGQLTLGTIIDRHPLVMGLSELVAYMQLVSSMTNTIFDETQHERVSWKDAQGVMRSAEICRILLSSGSLEG